MEMPKQLIRPAVHSQAAAADCRRVLKELWMVVCLAALQAMWTTAKKVMKQQIRAQLALHPRGLDVIVAESAVVNFWELLHDFAHSASMPGSWRRLLPPDTPFLCLPHAGGRLVVNDNRDVVVG